METEVKSKSKLEEMLNSESVLILFNDDFNTYDFVIMCLMSICNKTYNQAKTIAYTVHNNGKCEVLYGERKKLLKLSEQLNNRNLTSSVEDN